jgi:hypothetical protein
MNLTDVQAQVVMSGASLTIAEKGLVDRPCICRITPVKIQAMRWPKRGIKW